jgi:hypothetical protein
VIDHTRNSALPGTPDTTLTNTQFEPDCLAAFDDLRGALIELYASVGADPEVPQETARRFGVNKTMTWNLSRVMMSTDPIAILPHVPGVSALRSLLVAMQRQGAKSAAIERVRSAAAALHKMIAIHVGDRATLELIVDGMGRSRGDHLELSRKLAFRGNSGLWGVQANTRLMTVFMSPNAESPDLLDIAMVRGYLGLRRLRSEVRWPIFQIRGWGNEAMTSSWKPLEENGDAPNGLPLLKRFGTVTPSDVEVSLNANGTDYLLIPGPIGNAGAIDCFVSDYARAAASKFRTDGLSTGEFGATISAPTERLIFDLIVHESLDFVLTPEVRAFGGIFSERVEESAPGTYLPIAIPPNVSPLPGRPPVVATPHVARYPEIVSFVHERMGWSAGDFRGCRLEVSYPPLGSTVLLRFKLPAPEDARAE